MKKPVAFAVTLILLCTTNAFALTGCTYNNGDSITTTTANQTTTGTTLDEILDEIDQNTTVTENPDGTTTYTYAGSTIVNPIIPSTSKPISTATQKKTTSTASTTKKSGSTGTTTQITVPPSTTQKPAPIPTVFTTTTTTTTTKQSGVSTSATTTTTKKIFSYEYTSNQKHTWLPLEQRYYYSLLDDEWKGYYRQIDAAVRNLEAEVTFNTDITQDSKHKIYFIYCLDTPELFYLACTMTLRKHGNETSSISFLYSVGNKPGEYGGGMSEITDTLREKIRAKKAKFDKAVNDIISTIPANVPDVVKERMIYDKILLSSEYNLPAANGDSNAIGGKWDGLAADNWTAYGILINHTGVCESYAESFQTLCNAVGIPCTRISNDNHAWNAVKIGGKWYQCDVTFDDPVGGDPDDAYHYYFNLTDERLRERAFHRTWQSGPYVDEGFFKNLLYPVCTATEYGFENFVKLYGK